MAAFRGPPDGVDTPGGFCDPCMHEGCTKVVRMHPDLSGPVSAPSAPVLARRRVLVVEDEYFLADDIVRALVRLGAEAVGPVATREAALACLEDDWRIDACVLDINLRGEMAFPVADALLLRGLPFVFATGYDRSMVPHAYDHVRLWEKPFHPERLVHALHGLLPEN